MSRHTRNKRHGVERIIELLETRRLFHDGVSLHVAFGLPTTPIDEPYNKDVGKTFSPQDDGVSYGWMKDNSANIHERHDPTAPDLLHRGYAVLPAADQNVWEIALPDDDYQVHIVAGDAASTAGRYRINVEGALTVDGTATAQNRWVEGTSIVSVRDGRLTVASAKGATTNKIDYIDITPFDDATTISVAGTPAAGGPHDGAFVFSRIGSVSDAATYDYIVGGSATAGRDYDALSGEVTFAAGSSTATVTVNATANLASTKTVMVTLVPGDTFLVDHVSATTTIAGRKPVGATTQAASFSITRINFQPDGTPVPDYYRVDTGMTYGLRANGLTYGWSADNRANTRDHDSSLSPDQRYDTLSHMQKGGNFSWEIAVPNGTYTVRIVAGDSDYTDSNYRINAEGLIVVGGTPTSANHWVEGTRSVPVKDGKLTISNAVNSSNNKIDFIEIAPGTVALPVVSVAASGNPAEGTASGKFTVTRTGDLSNSLVVNYTLGGSAINGTDYDALSGAVTIPAGAASADVSLHPIDDTTAESSENVTFAISTSSTYSNGQISTASRTINDNDTNIVNGSLKWSTKTSAPIVRAEAMGAYVAGKVYAFGGYIDRTYHPTAKADVYDVAANKWSSLRDLPFGALTHAGTTTEGNFVYLAGGYPGSATKGQTFSTRNVWQYNTTNDTWKAMPPLPEGRGAGTLVDVNHVLYFFGGADPNRKDASNMWKLDLNNTAAGWNTVASMPAPRNHVGGVALNGFIYAIGGQTGQDNLSVFKSDVWRYDPTTDTWKTVASLINQPRSHIAAAAFAFNGKVVIEGGEGPGRVALKNVEQYDPAANKWTSLTPLPAGRSSGIGVSLGDKLLYTSGYSGVFNNQMWIGTFG